jgi:Fe-S cluster assembly ATP-binding protein
MLDIKDLTVSVSQGAEKKTILQEFSLHVDTGEVHVLFGPNGSGKTTLAQTILGYPGYTIDAGSIEFDGVDITNMPINERINLGLGAVFQYPPSIRGVRLNDMANLALKFKESDEVRPETAELARRLNVESFLQRDVNYGFSGGEKKRAEVLQVMLQDPKFLLLDEADSGVDVENVEIIGRLLNKFLQRDERPAKRKKSALIITHIGYLLNFIKTDRAHVLCAGQLLCSGHAKEIYETILKNGFEQCQNACLIEARQLDSTPASNDFSCAANEEEG